MLASQLARRSYGAFASPRARAQTECVTGRLGQSAASGRGRRWPRLRPRPRAAGKTAWQRRAAPTPVHVIHPSMMGFDRPCANAAGFDLQRFIARWRVPASPPTARRRAVSTDADPPRVTGPRPFRRRASHSIPSPLPSQGGDIIPRVEWTRTDAHARSPPSSHQAGIGPVDPQPQGVQTQYHCSAEPHRSASPRTLARSRHAPPASVRPSAHPSARATERWEPITQTQRTQTHPLPRLRSFAKSSECPRFLPFPFVSFLFFLKLQLVRVRAWTLLPARPLPVLARVLVPVSPPSPSPSPVADLRERLGRRHHVQPILIISVTRVWQRTVPSPEQRSSHTRVATIITQMIPFLDAHARMYVPVFNNTCRGRQLHRIHTCK